MESYRIIISGKVQHVYYRKFISQAFQKLGIQGYIRNLPDTTVKVIARIYDDDYSNVIEVLRKGSPLSAVSDISIDIINDDDIIYDGFEIRT
ncbi:MAG: acylphosphatase [Sulfurovum sp.]|nr:acylphosphatase [Sulfurovum sp.]